MAGVEKRLHQSFRKALLPSKKKTKKETGGGGGDVGAKQGNTVLHPEDELPLEPKASEES